MRSGDNARAAQQTSKDPKQKIPKQLIERIKEATNATDEVIIHTLEECNYDPNEATTRLIESEPASTYCVMTSVLCGIGTSVSLPCTLQTPSWNSRLRLRGSSRYDGVVLDSIIGQL